MDCNAVWGTLQAHPFRVEKEVRVQCGGRPREVGSKFTGERQNFAADRDKLEKGGFR